MILTAVMVTPMVAKGVTVGAIEMPNRVVGKSFDNHDRQLLKGVVLRASYVTPQLHVAECRARDWRYCAESAARSRRRSTSTECCRYTTGTQID